MAMPEVYEKFKKNAQCNIHELTIELISNMDFNFGEHVLDFGCGCGSTTKNILVPTLYKFGAKINAFDISDVMITYARKHYADKSIQFTSGDIMDLNPPFANSTFDKILSIHTFHLIKEPRPIMEKLFNILKPGGQFGIIFSINSYSFDVLKTLAKDPKWKQYMEGYEQYLTDWCNLSQNEVMEYFKISLTKAGFQINGFELIKDYVNAPIEAWTNLLSWINPFTSQIPTELHKDLSNEALDIMKLNGLEITGPYNATFVDLLLVIQVTKPKI